ncbi:hypothetical protein ID866_7924 [Astraeus odoratus]|nr:hypothetical protein ID866_7924 [Astraeus odoratus]
MPKDIETTLTKHAKNFAWDGEGKSTGSHNLLCAPINNGGNNMLNLQLRNEAIELMWPKKLLLSHGQCPTSAYFAHAILSHFANKTPTTYTKIRINTFLQSWDTQISKLPSHLKRMMKVAKKHHLTLDALAFHPNLLHKMPIWFHRGAETTFRNWKL